MSVKVEEPDLREQVERRLREHRREQIATLGREGVAWLALAPRWTLRLAEAAGFPFGKLGPEGFVKAAEAAGLCTSARSGSYAHAAARELEVLTALGGELPKELVSRALALLTQSEPNGRAVVALAPALDESQALFCLGLASALLPGEAALMISALLDRLPAERRGPALEQAVAAARSAPARVRLPVLADLATREPALAAEVLAELPALEGDVQRARVLTRLAPHVPHEALLTLPDPALRVDPALAAGALDDVARWLEEIAEPPLRDAARRRLAAALARAGRLDEAEAQARRIGRDDTRALALGDIAAAAPGTSLRLIDSALLTLDRTVSPWRAVTVLCSVSRALAGSVAHEHAAKLAHDAAALAAAQPLTTEGLLPTCRLVDVLDPKLAPEHARRALAIARSIPDPRERCEALLLVMARLEPPQQGAVRAEAIEALRAVADPLARAPLLRGLRDPELIAATARLAAATAEELTFSMPDAQRPAILAELKDPEQRRRPLDLVKRAAEIATRLGGVIAPPDLQRWAQLTVALVIDRDTGATNAFLEAYGSAVRAGDVAGALDWIETGDQLVGTLGDGRLAAAVRYARRRLELVYREAHARGTPEPFLERAAQLEAFHALRADGGEAWALHYLGSGGVGKSMLIRHLQRAAVAENAVTAKVDFDYLSPDYPVRRPAELLFQLMAELELYASEREESLLASFRDAVVKLHEESVDEDPQHALAQLDASQFQAALGAFCDYLQALGRPVVLFLDTCEELTRRQPRDRPSVQVDAAFGAIERIHERYPAVRVVLAGRRLLAAKGYGGWQAAHGMGAAQRPRGYLRVHRIDGFDDEEAKRFLHTVRKLELDPPLERAVLEASPQLDHGEALIEPSVQEEPQPERFNPFDLGMYADWIAEEGKLDPAALKSGETDPYVDLRILRRLKSDELRALVPAATLLWRLDEELLAPAHDGPREHFEAVFSELISQEWISGEREYVVDANLRRRLLRHYRQPAHENRLKQARGRLAPAVEQRLQEAPLGQLSPEHLEGALAILPDADFTAAWHGIVARAADEGRWDWLELVAGRLMGEDGGLGREHPARAAVTAAFAAAELHLGTTLDLDEHWAEVLETAERDPDREARSWLRLRAQLALAKTDEDLPWLPPLLDAGFRPDRMLQLAAALCAALERCGARSPGIDLAELADEIEALGAEPALCAALYVLAARASDDELQVAACFEAALACVAGPAITHAQSWLDWLAPASPRERVRLEALLHGPPISEEELSAWSQDVMTGVALIDADRLLSAIYSRRLESRLLSEAELQWAEEIVPYDPHQRSLAGVHRAVRPLFATLALGWAARGDGPHALGLLRSHVDAANQSAIDPDTVREGERAELLVRRRLREDNLLLVNRLARSEDPEERDAALAVIALTRPPGDWPQGVEDVPWRYRTGLSPTRKRELIAYGEQRWEKAEPQDADEWLDREESLRLRGRSRPEPLRALPVTPGSAMRAAALGVRPLGEMAEPGPRRVAELALEAGELLALRLPGEARAPLEYARERFRAAGDPFGVLIATIRIVLAAAHAGEASDRKPLGNQLRSAQAEAEIDLSTTAVGWHARYLAAMAWCEEVQEEPAGVAVPVELDTDPARGAEPSPGRARVRNAALVVLGLVLMAGTAWLAALLVRFALSLFGADVSTGAGLGIAAGLVALGAGLNRVVGRQLGTYRASLREDGVRSSLARLTVRDTSPLTLTVELRLSPLATGELTWRDLAQLSLRSLRATVVAADPLLALHDPLTRTAKWPAPPPDLYADVADSFPAEILTDVQQLLAKTRKAPLALVVDAPPQLSGLPWEALLTRALGPRAQPLRYAPGPHAASDPRADRLVVLGAPVAAWQAWTGPVHTFEGDLKHAVQRVREQGAIRVLHAVGRPVSGTVDHLFQIGGDLLSGTTVEQSVRSSGRVVGAEELTVPGAITVLQAEPVELFLRLNTNREEARKLKRIGADVAAAGAATVLVIPSLPPALAQQVVERVAQRLRRRRRYDPLRALDTLKEDMTVRFGPAINPPPQRLLDLADELRALIAGAEGAPWILAELAADVVLFT